MLLLMERQALALQLVISGCGRCGASIWRRYHTSKSWLRSSPVCFLACILATAFMLRCFNPTFPPKDLVNRLSIESLSTNYLVLCSSVLCQSLWGSCANATVHSSCFACFCQQGENRTSILAVFENIQIFRHHMHIARYVTGLGGDGGWGC